MDFNAASDDDISDILNELNDAQRQAVSAPADPVLVLAGAGSGKTRVLVHRIAWLIKVERVSPYSILAVTFTNKAAAEMRGRIEKLLEIPATGLWVGTFHGLAHRLLRMHWQEAKLPQNFQIIDSQDQLGVIKRIHKSLELDDTRWPPKQSMWYINARKDEGIRPQHMQDTGDPVQRQLVNLYKAYQSACERGGLVDFGELLLRCLETLRDNESLLKHYRDRFQHILVDEFQDTNSLQYSWLQLLAGKTNPIFAVGDDDQSIYGWRGAKVEHLQTFDKDHKNTQVVRLEQNYRSTSNILNAANAVIANNAERLGKNLWTAGNDGEQIQLYTAYNEQEEARYVAERIRQHVDGGGLRTDVAVLYRSNAQSRVFEEVFIGMRIPYKVYGGLRFFERAEIKDALAYLRLGNNPNDDSSFERVVNRPTRGIGARTVEIIRGEANEHNITMFAAAQQLTKNKILPARASGAVNGFISLVEDISAVSEELPLYELVDHINAVSGLLDFHGKENNEKSQSRIDNLNELVSAAQGFVFDEEEFEGMSLLDAFLSHAALESGEGQGESWEDCVQMMTLHSAKGLEFPLVFITGMEDGLFPHQMSRDEPGRLEEERRLCYVGITRARENLVLTLTERRRLHGSERYNMPSPFIGEIPHELVNEIRPSVPTGRGSRTSYSSTKSSRSLVDDENSEFKLGDQVFHQKFGEGMVTNYEGAGSHARIQINFKHAGSKWLVVAYANLEKS